MEEWILYKFTDMKEVEEVEKALDEAWTQIFQINFCPLLFFLVIKKENDLITFKALVSFHYFN